MNRALSDDPLLRLARAALPSPGGRIGVAVSGGSDSMAALHLLHAAGAAVEAVTVDHGLRPEAAGEARMVAAACAGLGVPHAVLRWEVGPGESGNLMDQARRARYALIAGWARARGVGRVVLAHTADDAAETFLMRLAREAGIDGLSGMREAFEVEGTLFVRPFLAATRASLRAWLTARGIGWAEDPTNSDMRYDRARARQALAALAPLGVDAEGLAAVAGHLRSVRAALDAVAVEAFGRIGREEAGDVVLDRAGLAALPDEVQRRLVVAALRFVSGAGYPPRAAPVAAILAASRVRTLHGCRVAPGEELRFSRELAAVSGIETATTALWDGRWRLDGPHAPGLTVRALGEGLAECDWRGTGLPRATLAAGPAVWSGGRLVAAPLAGKPEGWTAALAKHRNRLSQFLMSH